MTKNDILTYLDELIPEPKCELNYNEDYELLISTMLSAQTTDKRVNEVTSVLYKRYPSVEDLSGANVENIIDIIRPLGNYHKKAFNVIGIASRLVGMDTIPNDREFLESLPGVGRKTANVYLSNIYGENCIAVDTHVERVSKRLGLAKPIDTPRVVEEKLEKYFKGEDLCRVHHQLLLFGRYFCKSKNPLCLECKFKNKCKKNTSFR